MRFSILTGIFFLASVATIVIGQDTVGQRQTSPTSQALAAFTSLTFEIALPDPIVYSLEPIPVKLKLTNNNSRSAQGYRQIGFGVAPVSLCVRKVGAERQVAIPQLTAVEGLSAYTNVPMPARSSVESSEVITIFLARYFSEPGTYELQAKLSDADGTQFIESNVASVRVDPPSVQERSAYNLINSGPEKDFLFSGLHLRSFKDKLEQIALAHPHTPYARYSNFRLGEHYFLSRNPGPALVHLARLEDDVSFIFANRVREYLISVRQSLNRATH